MSTPMRLKTREISDRQRLEALLAEIGHGTLAMTGADGWPVLRPLNFVLLDGNLYFHGSAKGEKMDVLATDDRASFIAIRDYSLIPSFFTEPERACPATQYYQSVLVRGRARVVDDLDEKARALQALMEKLQPEGGYVPITADHPLYAASVKGTAVFRLDVEAMVGKENLGQDKPVSRREAIEAGLAVRNRGGDAETVAAMRSCPIRGPG